MIKNNNTTRLAQIVSPPFACGVAWLINALLYLNIRVTSDAFINHWQEDSSRWQIKDEALNHLKWHLPVLHEREIFDFPEDLEVRWEHRLDFAAREACTTILFVRDPRDAVYSLYRRNYSTDISFTGFLTKPDEWPDHFPNLFHLPPIETYAYFCYFWLSMKSAMPVKVVRFEDAKANALHVLKDVLSYLDIVRTEEEIQLAIKSSDFNQARIAMEEMELTTGKKFKTAVKGQSYEWRSTYSNIDMRLISITSKDIINKLGYSSILEEDKVDMTNDYTTSLSRFLPPPSRDIAINSLFAFEKGSAINLTNIAQQIILNSVVNEELLKLSAILLAIFYIENIFFNTRSKQRQIAINTMVNLNIKYYDDWPVKVAAFEYLNRLSSDTKLPMLNLLGDYKLQLYELSQSWKLFK